MDPTDNEFLDDEGREAPGEWVPVAGADGVLEPDRQPPSRRSFLKAAALGIGATSPFWRSLIPFSAFGHDATGLNCTANDVRIVGPGVIVNEPCNCTGTFTAQVQFTVENNAAAERHCITVHFCPVRFNGQTIDLGDVLIGTIPGKTTRTVTVNIPNYPCGAGLICFGGAGSQPDGSFLKGEACPDDCCTVISWDVGQPQSEAECRQSALDPIPSKCRRQQVCIRGRGTPTLNCDPATTDPNCTVPCGTSASLQVCANNLGPGPYTYKLLAANGTTVLQTFGPTSATCHTFTVSNITTTTTFNASVTDSGTPPCTKATNAVTVTTQAPQAAISVAGNNNCNGVLTFTATAAGFSGCTVAWKVDGNPVAGQPDGTLRYGPVLDGVCHRIDARVTCGGCVADAPSKSVSQCATTTNC